MCRFRFLTIRLLGVGVLRWTLHRNFEYLLFSIVICRGRLLLFVPTLVSCVKVWGAIAGGRPTGCLCPDRAPGNTGRMLGCCKVCLFRFVWLVALCVFCSCDLVVVCG